MESVSFRTIEGTQFVREPRALVIETEAGKVRVTSAEMSRFIDWYERDQPMTPDYCGADHRCDEWCNVCEGGSDA